jgi:hypothetical protein
MAGDWIDVPAEEPTVVAENFSTPGPAEALLARYRGDWTVGTLYNVRDMARYTGGDTRLLMLCIATHVAKADFEAEKWAVLADLGSLGSTVSAEEIAAVLAAVQEIEDTLVPLSETVGQTAEEVGQNAANALAAQVEATAQAALAAIIVNLPPGSEWAPGKRSAEGLLDAMEGLLGKASTVDEITIGNHSGEEGTDGVEQTFTAVAAHLNGRVRFVRPITNRDALYKIPPSLFTQPSEPGKDGKLAFIDVYNDGAVGCAVEIEGTGDPSGSGSVTLKPTRLREASATAKNTNTEQPATTVSIPFTVANGNPVPAGTNRKFHAGICVAYHVTPTTAPSLTAPAGTASVTSQGTDGGGGPTSTDPLHIRAWTGTLSADTEFEGTFQFPVQAGWASYFAYVIVRNNTSGFEDITVLAVDDASDNEVTAAINPATAGASADAIVFFQGGDADTGLGLTPGTDLRLGTTGVRTQKDFAYARQAVENLPASAASFTGVSNKSAPRAIIVMVNQPVVTTTGGGGDDNIKPPLVDRVLDPGEGAVLQLLNDGLTVFMTRY